MQIISYSNVSLWRGWEVGAGIYCVENFKCKSWFMIYSTELYLVLCFQHVTVDAADDITKTFWGDRTRITDPNWPKECPIPFGIESERGCCCSDTGWASVSEWWVIALCITCFVCLYMYIYYCYFPFLFYPIMLSLPQPMNFIFFWFSSPSHVWG